MLGFGDAGGVKMCSEEQAKEMYRLALAQGLAGAEQLADTAKVMRNCNGIGAEWFAPWLRWLICKLHPTLVATSFLHDLAYAAGGGWRDRWRADWVWLCNGWRAAKTYAWCNVRRYVVQAQALFFWCMLRIGGHAAFAWSKEAGNV